MGCCLQTRSAVSDGATASRSAVSDGATASRSAVSDEATASRSVLCDGGGRPTNRQVLHLEMRERPPQLTNTTIQRPVWATARLGTVASC